MEIIEIIAIVYPFLYGYEIIISYVIEKVIGVVDEASYRGWKQ